MHHFGLSERTAAMIRHADQILQHRASLSDASLMPPCAALTQGTAPNPPAELLARRGFVLHYQPIVRLGDGRVERWEALLRLKDPHEGLLTPNRFLPHAIRLGIMPELDLWAVRSVLRRLAANRDVRVAVNLSVQTLQDKEALTGIRQAVVEGRVEPGQLMFEISEVATVRDVARVTEWIQAMKRLGCRFALDDFGTGVSSFEHLRTLDVDAVKIDGSYVQQIGAGPECLAFVEGVAAMCQAMGVETVAEGIESASVVPLLARAGVGLGQGFLLGRPEPFEDFRGPVVGGSANRQ